MKAKGVRLHAANDLSLEEFELPEITDDEILVKVVSDSICMSTSNVRSSELCYAPVSAVVTQSSAILGRFSVVSAAVSRPPICVTITAGLMRFAAVSSRDNTEHSEDPGWKEINL